MSVTLVASDGTEVQLADGAIKLSTTLLNMLEDLGEPEEGLPVPNVTGPVLTKVVEWMEHHYLNPSEDVDKKIDDKYYIPPWDAEFFNVSKDMLFDIIMAANYLDIAKLSDMAYKVVANMLAGKSTEEMRTMFNIKSDLTPEEEEAIRRENAWMLE